MNKLIKYLLYGMPVFLLLLEIGFSDRENYAPTLAPLLIVFILVYVIQISLIPLYGGHVLALTIIHFISYTIALYLIFNTHMWSHVVGYGVALCLVLWATGEFKRK